MGKIIESIYEFHHMDHMWRRKNWLNQIHPLVKLIVTISYIITLVSLHKYQLSKTLLMMIYPIILMNSIHISFRKLCKKIWPILLFVSLIGLFNPMLDHTPMIRLGNVIITGGMVSAITLVLKGTLAVLASITLIMTTGMEGICNALRLLHIPSVFVSQILLTYRYIIVLLEEAEQIHQAYSLRAPRQRGIHIRVWGSLLGQLLFRSIDRANVIYESMLIRGYHGTFCDSNKRRPRIKDFIYLLIWLIFFVLLSAARLS